VQRRRWWLAVVSVASLVVLIYAGVFTAFSVPVTTGAHAGTRALIVPVADATAIPTVRMDGNGTLIVIADPGASFPAAAGNVTIVRALAYVTPTADGTYVPANETFNLSGAATTLDIAALAGGKSGYLVYDEDAKTNATFATTDRVVGAVSRFDASTQLVAYFIIGSFGFVIPLVVLMATHKGAGVRGPPAGVARDSCPECRAPVPPGQDFCTRCGAWVQERAR
jgi:hypothetical protein